MAESTIIGPDGAEYTIQHPDGATEAQKIRYVQQQIASGDLVADQPQDTTPVQVAEAPPDFDVQAALNEAQGINPLLDTAMDTGRFAVDVAMNAPGSLLQQGQNLWQAVTNPGETLAGLQELTQSAGNKLGRLAAEQMTGQELEVAPERSEETIDAAIDMYGDRYGSREAALETIRTDPAGFALDVSGVLAPVSARLAAKINPAIQTTRGASAILGKGLRSGAETIMESAIKPSTVIPSRVATEIVDTALDYGINPSARGLEKLNRTRNAIGREIGNLIENADASGVPVSSLFRYLDDLRAKKGGALVDADVDLDIINKMEQRLRDNIAASGKDILTPQDLQAIKLDLDTKIDWTPGSKTKKTTKMETRREMRRAAKEDVAEMVPDIAPLNEEYGRLSELRKPLERAERRIGNRDIIGMGDFLSLGGGLGVGALTANPALGGALWLGSELVTNPRISPTVARGANISSRIPNAVVGALATDPAITVLPAATAAIAAEQEIDEWRVPYLYGDRE